MRYGVVASDAAHVAGRVFNHNESLDFCAAVAKLDAAALRTFFADLFELEVTASRRLEGIFFGATRTPIFRNEIVVSPTFPNGFCGRSQRVVLGVR